MTYFVPAGFFLAAIIYTACVICLANVVGRNFAHGQVQKFSISFNFTFFVDVILLGLGMYTASLV